MTREADVQRLAALIAHVLQCNGPMTEQRIASAICRRVRVRTDAGSVRLVLQAQPSRFVRVKDRFRFLRRASRWRLVEAGSADDAGTAGAPVPAPPRPPSLSTGAAAELRFRDEDPPPQAIGHLI